MHQWTVRNLSIPATPPMRVWQCQRCGLRFTLPVDQSIQAVAARWPCRDDTPEPTGAKPLPPTHPRSAIGMGQSGGENRPSAGGMGLSARENRPSAGDPAQAPLSPGQPPTAADGVPPAMPGLAKQVWHYTQALARWLAEGRPVRPPAEIQRILAICQACPHYNHPLQRCALCGCRANESENAWLNKIAMATEKCPLGKWEAMPQENSQEKLFPETLKTFVQRVYVINLKRRPDRLKTFLDRLERYGWPFPQPIIYPAIEGDKVGVPPEFTQGGGAYGCRMSHLRILQDCLMEDVQSVLILEDDAEITEGFSERVAEFLAKVPSDWEGIMLGGQHHAPPKPTGIPGVVRVQYAQRTHAYIARPSYMKALQQRWGNCTVHIDWAMRDWQHRRIVYAPDPWLIGQAGGRSDIRGAVKPREWWSSAIPPDSGSPPPQQGPKPVILLRASRPVAEQLQRFGWHGGYSRDPATGYDTGLKKIAQEKKEDRPQHLRAWIDMIQREAEDAKAICTVWHPEITLEDLRQAYSGPILEIQAQDVESAFEQLPPQWREFLEQNPAPNQPPVVCLEAPEGVIQELQHKHHWLCARAPEPMPDGEHCRRWLARLRRQAAQEGRVLAVWGNGLADLPKLAIPTERIQAQTPEEAIDKFLSGKE